MLTVLPGGIGINFTHLRRCISVAIISFSFFTAALSAEEPKEYIPPATAPIDELHTILQSETFGKQKTTWRIVQKKKKENKAPRLPGTKGWERFAAFIAAHILRAIVIAAAVTAIIILIIMYKRSGYHVKRKKNIVVNHTVSPAEAPALALLQSAESFYAQGRQREAWSLLFSCALRALFSQKQARKDATEYEYLRLVKEQTALYFPAFEQLVKNKIRIAYQGIIPEANEWSAALEFCKKLLASDYRGQK